MAPGVKALQLYQDTWLGHILRIGQVKQVKSGQFCLGQVSFVILIYVQAATLNKCQIWFQLLITLSDVFLGWKISLFSIKFVIQVILLLCCQKADVSNKKIIVMFIVKFCSERYNMQFNDVIDFSFFSRKTGIKISLKDL